MELRLQKPAFWARLSRAGGSPRSWALGRELALGTTSDQLPAAPDEAQRTLAQALQGSPPACSHAEALAAPPLQAGEPALRPHLGMWVDPNLVCPISGHLCKQVLLSPPPPTAPGLEGPRSASTCLGKDLSPLPCQEAEKQVVQDEEASRPDISSPPPPAGGTCSSSPGEARPRKAKGSRCRCRGRKPRRVQGGWPRPPLNYCILISLALNSSVDSSLTVQEIYQFTRQHFPFFRTAPEGWKNTVRHNLCFSSSFEKTTDFVCLEGNRKSRLWRLTSEGQRKFQEDARALPEDTVGLVHESMERPELMRSLFGL